MAKTKYISSEELKLNNSSLLNADQIREINKVTPKDELIDLENGFKGVSVGFVEKKLNIIFGWDWSFSVVSEIEHTKGKSVIIKGRMTIVLKDRTIVRENYGSADIAVIRDSKGSTPLIGDAYKSARADALKKIASSLGICWDVYGGQKEEPKKSEQKLTANEQAIYTRLVKFSNGKTKEDVDNLFRDALGGYKGKVPIVFTELYIELMKRFEDGQIFS